MLLAIDIGNTNIVLGGIEGEKTLFTERLSTDTGKTDLEYALLFDTALRIHSVDPASVSGAIIGSVVPPINSVIQAALQKVCSVQALIVGPGIRTGLNIRMEDPASVGADLIAGAVGALASYDPPLIVIDMGTATTLCVVDAQRSFIGRNHHARNPGFPGIPGLRSLHASGDQPEDAPQGHRQQYGRRHAQRNHAGKRFHAGRTDRPGLRGAGNEAGHHRYGRLVFPRRPRLQA